MTSFLFILYLHNRQSLFHSPPSVVEPVSFIVPCYNAENTIGAVLDSLLRMDYPRSAYEIIVVDDKSKDNSTSVVRNYISKHPEIRLIVNSRNSGAAAEPTNIGVKNAKYGYVCVVDDDSIPQPDALRKMIGFLQHDPKVAAVTCAVMARNPRTFLQKLQAIEYTVIAWGRKLLDTVDSVYVTPGPFALYRKDVLIKVGLFDTKNLTQDIEIVWRLLTHGYKARMCLNARVYSETPHTFRSWFKQRLRWNIGGTQTLIKYRRSLFKNGMLGGFIIPFFGFSLFLGLIGLFLFVYLFARRLIVNSLITSYSLYSETTILRLQDLSFSPSVLNFFGVALFLFGLFFTLFGLSVMNERKAPYNNIFNLMFYLIVYLTIYPIIMITSLYKLVRGTYSW